MSEKEIEETKLPWDEARTIWSSFCEEKGWEDEVRARK